MSNHIKAIGFIGIGLMGNCLVKRLIKKEYTPIGNRLVYPKKWGRKRAAEVLLNHQISENERLCNAAKERLEYLNKLKEDVDTW